MSAQKCKPQKNKFFKKLFKNVGYSGHCEGIQDGVASSSFDIKLIEKHFTINKKLPGRDNKFAILPNELKELSDYYNSKILAGNR